MLSDYAMTSTSTGHITADVTACPSGNAAINFAWIHDLTGLPDSVVFEYDNMPYCAASYTSGNINWPNGHYHWNAVERFYPQPNGYGTLKAVD